MADPAASASASVSADSNNNNNNNNNNNSGATAQLKRVCLFGLSADPPTGESGHVGIVRALQQQASLFDEIRVLPVYRHTYADKRQRLVSFPHRLAMCRAAFDNVTVSDAEYQSWLYACRDLPTDQHATVSVGTASLLEYLQIQEPNSVFYFCLGADAFLDLVAGNKWKESARVLQLLQGRLIVLERAGTTTTTNDNSTNTNSTDNNDDLKKAVAAVSGAQLLQVQQGQQQLSEISSSAVRACTNVEQLQTMVVPAVLEYMRQHGLYAAFETTETNE